MPQKTLQSTDKAPITQPIYIINLERSHERRVMMQERLDALGLHYEFIKAIDGNTLTPDEQSSYAAKRRRLFYGHDLTFGEIGCLLSHRKVYRHMIENNIDCAIVLEDDVFLDQDFPEVVRHLMALKQPWDMIRFLASPKTCRRSRKLFTISEARSLARPYGTPGGAYGYMLTLRAARRLNAKMQKNYIPVDTLHGQVWKTGLQIYNIVPSPVTYNDVIASTIGEERYNKRGSLNLKEKVIFPITRGLLKISDLICKRLFQAVSWPSDSLARHFSQKN